MPSRKKPKNGLSPRELKVSAIIHEMERGIWTASLRRSYAAQWHVSDAQMDQLSAEASRTLRLFISTDKDTIRATLSSALQHVIREASKDRKWKEVAYAIKTQAEMLGVMAPVELNITSELESLSDEELEKRTAELVAQVRPIEPEHVQH